MAGTEMTLAEGFQASTSSRDEQLVEAMTDDTEGMVSVSSPDAPDFYQDGSNQGQVAIPGSSGVPPATRSPSPANGVFRKYHKRRHPSVSNF